MIGTYAGRAWLQLENNEYLRLERGESTPECGGSHQSRYLPDLPSISALPRRHSEIDAWQAPY